MLCIPILVVRILSDNRDRGAASPLSSHSGRSHYMYCFPSVSSMNVRQSFDANHKETVPFVLSSNVSMSPSRIPSNQKWILEAKPEGFQKGLVDHLKPELSRATSLKVHLSSPSQRRLNKRPPSQWQKYHTYLKASCQNKVSKVPTSSQTASNKETARPIWNGGSFGQAGCFSGS